MLKSKSQKSQKGFTVLEMIVALGLFTVVVTVAVGALTALGTASGKAQSSRIVMDNLNFTVENIARSMRVGTKYHCGSGGTLTDPLPCQVNGEQFIAFLDSQSRTVAFRLNAGRIEKSTNCSPFLCSDWLGITDPALTITEFRFFVTGAFSGDGVQPKALLVVVGTAGRKDIEEATFNLQTLITQRLLDS
ncbi:MAG: prepilin-type N-terminal cleavage/methylation domain-containing protein [Parcubacteria group bacterium]|nr:prepilin-type N-terminal cleavage/methylation domain-containing protein [Parcubacteria group bacterium]